MRRGGVLCRLRPFLGYEGLRRRLQCFLIKKGLKVASGYTHADADSQVLRFQEVEYACK